MRVLWSGQRRLKETFEVLSVATYSATGMFTIPNCIEPFQMDRGMCAPPARLGAACRAASRAQRRPPRQAGSSRVSGITRWLGAPREPEDPTQHRRVTGPVLGHDLRGGRANDIAERERRDDRVVHRA